MSKQVGGVDVRNTFVIISIEFAFVVSLLSMIISSAYADSLMSSTREYGDDELTAVRQLSDEEIILLSEGYRKPKSRFGKIQLDVPVVNQYPELPNGCEITSATAYLNYIGIKVDKLELCDNYLPRSNRFTYSDNGRQRTGPDPYETFVGNPKKTGFGCYNTVIEKSLNDFFDDRGYKYEAIILEDLCAEDLEALIRAGMPIQVWASSNMVALQYIDSNKWTLETTGEEFCWPKNSHSLILCGYDNERFYFSDPNNKMKIVAYRKKDFLERWEQLGKQSIVIKINDEKYEKYSKKLLTTQ